MKQEIEYEQFFLSDISIKSSGTKVEYNWRETKYKNQGEKDEVEYEVKKVEKSFTAFNHIRDHIVQLFYLFIFM